jgi:hypothetical protein
MRVASASVAVSVRARTRRCATRTRAQTKRIRAVAEWDTPEEALGQQRRDAVGMNGDECACADDVVASDRTAGEDGKDGQEAAQYRYCRYCAHAAAGTVGMGAVSAKTPRGLAAVPPYQRASDFHDDTRFGALKRNDLTYSGYTSQKACQFLSWSARDPGLAMKSVNACGAYAPPLLPASLRERRVSRVGGVSRNAASACSRRRVASLTS